MIKAGEKEMLNCKIGAKQVFSIYQGENLVWELPRTQLTIATTAANQTFTIRNCEGVLTNWGDGSAQETLASATATHTFAVAGTYTIKVFINDVPAQFCFNQTLLQSVRLSRYCTVISDYAFQYCSALTYVNFNNAVNLKTIGFLSFFTTNLLDECDLRNTKLTTVADGVNTTGGTFSGNKNLKKVFFPTTLKTIGSFCFTGTNSLEYVNFTDLINLTNINSCAFMRSNLKEVDLRNTKITTLVDGYFNEGYGIFSDNPNLTAAYFPAAITKIGISAFCYCNKLQYNNFTELVNLTTIGGFGFLASLFSEIDLRNTKLTTLPDGYNPNGNGVFSGVYNSNTELKNAYLPANFTSIGVCSFSFSTDSNLYVYAAQPPTLGSNGIRNVSQIHVPAASLTAYQAATGWSTYASKMLGDL